MESTTMDRTSIKQFKILQMVTFKAANVPVWIPPRSSSFEEFPFSISFPLLLLSRNIEMVYHGRLGKKLDIFLNKICLTGCKWSHLNASRSETPVSHSLLCDSLFSIFCPCCFLSSNSFCQVFWIFCLASSILPKIFGKWKKIYFLNYLLLPKLLPFF